MNPNDEVRLHHMLDAAHKALTFADDQVLEKDLLVTYAVSRALSIVSLAASHVSADTRHQLPAIAWDKVLGLHEKILSNDLKPNIEAMRRVLSKEMPAVIAALEPVLSERG